MNKYLNREQIEAIIGKIVLEPNFSPMSQDSYNEELIAIKVNNLDEATKPKLCQAAINMAVVGFGNKRYGSYRVGDTIVDIKQLFDENTILYKNPPNALLKEDDLTPQRLCRFFRYQIKDYIKLNKVQSYLFRKYSNHDVRFFDIAFRGSEYLDDLTEEQRLWLIEMYTNLDHMLNTNILDRIKRVFQAKAGMTYRIIEPTIM
jgi:hypothetical protein